MRVLQINSVCGYGSTGRIATDLYDVLEKKGHECCIAYGRGNAPEGYNTIKIGNQFDFYSHAMKTRLFDLHGFGSTYATERFIKKIEEYKPDVIHLHNLHGYFLNIEVLFDYLTTLSVPVIWQLHDAWSMSGHGAHFELDENGQIPKKSVNKKVHKEYPKSFLIDNYMKNYLKKEKLFTQLKNMTVVTPSYWLSEFVNISFLKKYDLEVIHNGIDLDVFQPFDSDLKSEYNLQDEKILLGVASVWSDKKGLQFFNQLAERLDSTYKIILIGITEKQKKAINSKVLCIPRTESIKKLAEFYSIADIYLNPTLEDNFPTTNIEALACGTPIITFNTGGSPESLSKTTGFVVEKGDINQLITKIENFDYNKNYCDDCRRRAQVFNKDEIYQKYILLYKKTTN